MSKFCVDSFREPSKENHIVYDWVWNSPITRDSIDRQQTEYAACGIRGLYILPEPTDFRPETMRTFLVSARGFTPDKAAISLAIYYIGRLWDDLHRVCLQKK